MKRKLMGRLTGLCLATVMAVSATGCGSTTAAGTASSVAGSAAASTAAGTAEAEGSKKYAEPLPIDVFDSQANFQGTQTGWFAKIVKDKFNIELNIIAPNVAGGGDTLYQTRSANGNLGDLIVTNLDKSRLKDMVTAGLVTDMTPYMDGETNLKKYQSAIDGANKLAGQDGTWAVPSEISNQPATDPCDANEPTNAPSLRWDVYGAVGYPEMKTMEDMLPVLKSMQDKAGKSDSGKSVYALSLFKDWDGDIMQNAGALCSLYGYLPSGFCMNKVDGSDVQSVIDDDGIYVRSLKFLFQANQMGLVDPESTTQNFDTLQTKYKDGAVLYSLWPWLGAGQYNTAENTAADKGFQDAVIDDMKCLTYGSMPYGKMEVGFMVGSQAKDPQRMVDFIDWLYSPEGIEDAMPANCGPEGLTWEMKDNEPVLTDFGVQAFVDKTADLKVPDEWGGGTYTDGISALNVKTVGLVDTDDETGMCYNYLRWDDYTKRVASKLTEDWSSHHENETLPINYFKNNGNLLVFPGTNFVADEYSTDISTIKEQCKQSIVAYSWQMAFAKDEAEFNSLLKEMQDTVNGLGYDQVLAVDQKNCEGQNAAIKEASAK